MRDKREFHAILAGIDGKDPSSYTALNGDFDFTRFVLHRIHVSDTEREAPQASFVLHVPQLIAGFPGHLFESPIRRTALEDYLTREVAGAILRLRMSQARLENTSIRFVLPGPHILPRSAFVVAPDFVEARLAIRLPIRDGHVDAVRAEQVFFDALPQIVNEAMIYCYQDPDRVLDCVHRMEDADEIRQSLMQQGLVAFAAQGARCSSGGPPLDIEESLRTQMETPNAGPLDGLAIRSGITLVLGDPFSGRHEFIRALGDGVYNHIPEDGRSKVITVPDAVLACAEPGRPIQGVDLRAFLRDGDAVSSFSTESATSHESQMATCIEALQAGAQVLFFDEADSDAAFLSADSRLRSVSGGNPGRVIPLSDRIRQMANEWRVSVVIGAWACSGPFLASADRILWMDNGTLRDVTEAAQAAGFDPPDAQVPPLPELSTETRWLYPSSIDPALGRDDAVITVHDRNNIQFGRSRIDLSGVPQVADESQALTLGLILYYTKLHHLDTERSVGETLDLIDEELNMEGLDALAREHRRDLARPRRFEIASALNRLPTLRTADRKE